MIPRFGLVLPFVCSIVASACTTAEPAIPTGSTSSGSSSGTAGAGGAGGGGSGGGGGMMDDAFLCMALDMAGVHEPLTAGADETNASLLAAPDTMYDVTISQNGGFVALQLTMMHTTFVVYVGETEPFELLLDGTPVIESIELVTCNGRKFHRIQHHSHDPLKFVVALPPVSTNPTVVFYHVL